MPDKDKTVKQLIIDWASQGVFDAFGDALSIQDTDYKVLYQNHSHKNMLGEHIGEYCYKAYQRKDSVCENCHLAMSFKDGKVHKMEQVRATDDGIFYYETTASPLKDLAGKIIAGMEVVNVIDRRKQAEEALRITEAKNRALLEAIPDFIFVLNHEGVYLDYHAPKGQLLYAPPESFLGKNIRDVLPPQIVESYASILAQAIRSGESQLFEYALDMPDGQHHYEAHIVAYQGDHVLAVIRDITERKKTEEALHVSENLLREAQVIAGLGDYVLDISTGLWKSSEVLDKVFGIDEEYERSVEGWAALIHPDDRTMMRDYFRNEVLGQGRVFDKEYRIIRHDDHAERWVQGLGKLEFDEQGRPLKMHGTIQDITKRKKAEIALKQSEEKYRSLVDFTTDSIYLIDNDYKYLFINKQHLLRLGVSGQYINKAYSEFHSPKETELFMQKADNVFNSGESFQYEYQSFRDGRYFFQSLSPVRDSNNKTTSLTVISKDITMLKQAEEKLYSMSMTDDLTGLYNRRGFLALSEQQLKLAARENKKMFLMSADIDYLKLINDNVGHQKGDMAIINVANILKETFRESDIAARIGGDEFVVLGVDTPETNIETLVDRLRENLNAHNDKVNEPLAELSLSYGFTIYDPKHPRSIDELLSEADKLMYQHKSKKR
jgi:diguanylate cyclase (GGDEF)-like protein/PAS domain S-box-containing protein